MFQRNVISDILPPAYTLVHLLHTRYTKPEEG